MADKQAWKSWKDLTDLERRRLIAGREFWSEASDEQKQSFLEHADWQEIRLVPEAKKQRLDSLVPMEQVCKQLDLTNVQVALLISTRKLPVGALLDGAWKFDMKAVDRWVEQLGGIEAVRKDVDDQLARQRGQAT